MQSEIPGGIQDAMTTLDPHDDDDVYMRASSSSYFPHLYFKQHKNNNNDLRRQSMLHSWPPPNKQQTLFWAEEVSNSSEIVVEVEKLQAEINNRVVDFGELEAAIYNVNNVNHRKCPPVNLGLDHGHGSEEAEPATSVVVLTKNNNKKKKKRKNGEMEDAEYYLGKLVQQVMEHQDKLHNKFMGVVERLDGERRERRNQELAHLERELAEARVKDKALAMRREATILSYLQKFTASSSIHFNSSSSTSNTLLPHDAAAPPPPP